MASAALSKMSTSAAGARIHLVARYAQNVPVVCQGAAKPLCGSGSPRKLFIVPGDMPCSDFRASLLQHLQASTQAPSTSKWQQLLDNHSSMSEVYNEYKAEDGFLYIDYHADGLSSE
eukprot:TRINITY_DN41187_c0_g1_i1.p1 TRINITY_DN41187_c0_g1~~TRINITY_DN41187_c0_g1_i1.p1  ORF type:complete len:129 (+),score=27.44 TRINITY_DN41187_c0_g1_i1:38-388(+)